jgi:hypothetical protein
MDPFLGVVVLAILAGSLVHHLARRERRLSVYLPSAAFVGLFSVYAYSMPGFVWRYAGDFWPFVVLVCVHYVRSLPPGAIRRASLPLAAVLATSSFACYKRNVEPALTTLEIVDPHDPVVAPDAMWEDFTNSRYGMDPPLPSRFQCGDPLTWPWHNGQGWSSNCRVDTFTNVYLGVPAKSDDHFELRFESRGMTPETLRVYVNGRIYVAHRSGASYSVPVEIRTAALTSPIVMTTIEWTSAPDPLPVELLSVELL